MTKKELSRYYNLSIEIKDLEERIKEVRDQSIGASKITGMPHGTTVSNPVAKRIELIVKLTEILENKKYKAVEEQIKIENYISTITDPETRNIFTKRYINFKKWDDIALEMSISERQVHRIHRKHLMEGR